MRLPLIPAQRIPLCLPLATRKTSIQTPQVQIPAHNSDTAEPGTLPEPAGMQSVQQATTEPTAEDKPHENVVSAADTEKKMPLWLPLIPVKKMPLPPPLTTGAPPAENVPE
ncbi:hypothetical protein ACLB1N_35520 [Escherichia coli]